MESSTSQGAVAAHPPVASADALIQAREIEGRARGGIGARSPVAGLLWMALATTLFAAMSLLARLASGQVPWPEVAATRALVGGAAAIAIATARGAPLSIDRRERRLGWARSLVGTGGMVCSFYSFGAPQIALGDVVTLGATSPIFIALLSPWLLGERGNRWLWLFTGIAFAGVALIAGPTLHLAGRLVAIATLGAMFSAVAMILIRKLGSGARPASPEAIALHFSLVASTAMMACSIPIFRAPDARGALLLLATGVAGGLGQLAMTRAYALDHAARIGPVGYLGVALSHVLGATLLGDAPSAEQLAGAALVVTAGVGLALQAVRGARDRREEAPRTLEA